MLSRKEKEKNNPPARKIVKKIQRVFNSCVNPEQSQVALNYFLLSWEKYDWTDLTELFGTIDFNHPLCFFHIKISLNHYMNESEIRSSLNEL